LATVLNTGTTRVVMQQAIIRLSHGNTGNFVFVLFPCPHSLAILQLHFTKYLQGSVTIRVECGTHVFTSVLIDVLNYIDLHFHYKHKYIVSKLITLMMLSK
jgi:hypothetical protein